MAAVLAWCCGHARGESPPLEDLFEWRARAPGEPGEPPRRWLTPRRLAERGAAVYGWVDTGIGGNSWGSPYNGTVVMDDRSGQAYLDQLYLTGLRPLDGEPGWGGRVDLLYGTDWWTAVSRGLDAFPFATVDFIGVPRWSSSRYYGLAMPQAYVEFGTDEASVLVGHFYTFLGYEVLPAVGNFFYTRTYLFEYGTPTTHTGVLGSWSPAEGASVTAGICNGWDNFSDAMPTPLNPGYPGAGSNLAFTGETRLQSDDGRAQLAFALITGNEFAPQFDAAGDYLGVTVGNLTMYTVYAVLQLTDRLAWVVENAVAWQFHDATGYQNAGQLPGLAQWYGVSNYAYLGLTDRLAAGMRLEWFRDNNGSRVFYPLRNAVTAQLPVAGGFAGNFWALTWGLNWRPRANWTIRPEIRFDWYTPDAYGSPALPFGRLVTGADGLPTGTAFGQLYGGCDAVVQF